MRVLVIATLLGSCARTEPAPQLDHALVEVVGEPRLRTDTVGEGAHAAPTAFVLIDARNGSREPAVITLGGELTGEGGGVVGALAPQSLHVPAGEVRTFALIERRGEHPGERPAATGVRVVVRDAQVARHPPSMRIDELHAFDDHGRVVVQGRLVNTAARDGNALVIAAFHGPDGRPITRPFRVYEIGRHAGDTAQACTDTPGDRRSFRAPCTVQFIGPPGSTRGTIFVGDVEY